MDVVFGADSRRLDNAPYRLVAAVEMRSKVGVVLGLAAALPLAAWMWGFTVDDALIPVRYARHLAAGDGYRFNVGGPSTDGVTPLPWAFVLAPFARAAPLVVLTRAKVLGLAVWLAAAASWGQAVGRCKAPVAAKAIAVTTLALCV